MSDPLDGTSWAVTGPFELADGVSASVEFRDGRVAGHAGCNRFHGSYTCDGQAFSLGGPLATTMMLCPPPAMEVEQAVLAAFGAAAAVHLDGDLLALIGDDDAVVLQLAAVGPAALEGHWVVTSLHWPEREAIISVDEPDGSPLTVQFAEAHIGGNAGCNHFRGTFTTEGTNLAIGPLASTRKMCLDSAVMAQEQAMLAALAASRAYRVEGDRCTLLREGGLISLQLRRA